MIYISCRSAAIYIICRIGYRCSIQFGCSAIDIEGNVSRIISKESPTDINFSAVFYCNQAAILAEATCRPCETATQTITGVPGETVYFWVHTHYNVYPNGEYPYTLLVEGGTVATAERSWSAVRDLYR